MAKKIPLCVECKERPAARTGVQAEGDYEPWSFGNISKCSVCFLSQEFV